MERKRRKAEKEEKERKEREEFRGVFPKGRLEAGLGLNLPGATNGWEMADEWLTEWLTNMADEMADGQADEYG